MIDPHILVLPLVILWFLLPSGHRWEVPLGQLVGATYVLLAMWTALGSYYLITVFDVVVAIAYIAAPRGLASLRRSRD